MTSGQAQAPAGRHGPTRPSLAGLVVLGASAGGLDALCRTFEGIPASTGAAFVVVQHLSPDHKTLMDTLLARHTAMPVKLIEDGDILQADTVYLNPPGKNLTLDAHRLHLTPKPEHTLSLPIDDFCSVAATHWAERMVAVILSGTGSDGSRGIARVSAAGGTVVVQNPESAAFDGMPRNAIASGVTDLVLPPEDIGPWLGNHLLQATRTFEPDESAPDLQLAETVVHTLGQIAATVRSATGLDLDLYKPDMLLRRIRRRMLLLDIELLPDYATWLHEHPEEARLLRREVLIPVTRFFRDTEVYDQLREHTLPELLADHPLDQPFRVWVAATATGEEAYSMAMAIREACDQLKRWPAIKIYATDVEQRFLDIASAGSYPDSIATEVGPERAERFFTRREGRCIARPELRSMVVFAQHNLLADPPFTRMNLVSCRNMLIYLKPQAQDVVLRRLQYALLARGVLVLGRSESVGTLETVMSSLDLRTRVYRLERPVRTVPPNPSLPPDLLMPPAGRPGGSHTVGAALTGPALQVLARHYAPPAVLLDDRMQVQHVFGDLQGLLQVRHGKPSLSVADLLPPEVAPLVSSMLKKVSATGESVRSPSLSLGEVGGLGTQPRIISIIAVPGSHLVPAGMLMTFEESRQHVPLDEVATVMSLDQSGKQILEGLQHELDATREALQATIEALETSNEELQATNEELMASNEELQSTNEELQSVNEELYTVNAEYQAKLDLLAGINADLEGMTQATGLPSVFVDDELKLLRMTPELIRLFNLREIDIGRPITDFSHRLDYPALADDMRTAMRTGRVQEREVFDREGLCHLARLMPYGEQGLTPGSRRRLVASFIDLTAVKDASRLQSLIDAVPAQLALIDRQGAIRWVNRAWLEFARRNGLTDLGSVSPGANYLAVLHARRPDTPAPTGFADIEHGLREVLDGQRPEFFVQYPCHAPDERRWFAMHATPTRLDGGGALITHYNITRWVTRNKEDSDDDSIITDPPERLAPPAA